MNEIAYEVDILAGKLKSLTVDGILDRMGFPINYKDILEM
jgi:hypothetical protein